MTNSKQKSKIVLFVFLTFSLGFLTVEVYLANISNSVSLEKNSDMTMPTPKTNNLALLWDKTWGGRFGEDTGFDIAIDASDNIYISAVSDNGDDIYLLKYDSSGNLIWNAVYSEINPYGECNIAVDNSGYIYISGTTLDYGPNEDDIFLLKYDSSGNLIWIKIWGGIGFDRGYDVAVDSLGNIYITGMYERFTSSNKEMVLLKYDSSGNLVWNKTWGGNNVDSGYGVFIDDSDKIYISGWTRSYGKGQRDVVLLKYDSSGTLIWNTTWGDINDDIGYGIFVNGTNDIYITGATNSYGKGNYDVILLKYNQSGDLAWNKTFGKANLDIGYCIIGNSGNIFVSGYLNNSINNSYDVLLLKYDSSGNLIWNTIWGGSEYDVGYGVAVDGSGFIYLSGTTKSIGAGGSKDVLLLKYSSSGPSSWSKTWDGYASEYGYDVITDNSDNIYVTGIINIAGKKKDALLLKYDSSGALIWSVNWGGTEIENGYGVVCDNFGNIYVTGTTESYGNGENDVFLLKYNPSGNLIWNKTWGGGIDDRGYGIAVDNLGNIYITGITESYGAGLEDVFLLKYNSSGTLIWDKTWGGSDDDEGYSVAVDSSGNIYITGNTWSYGNGANDVILLKYNSDGSLLSSTNWGGADSDEGYDIAFDGSDNLYIVGSTSSSGAGNYDVLTLKYSTSGAFIWSKIWGGSKEDDGFGICIDNSDNIYITGSSWSYGNGNDEILLLQYSPSGTLNWNLTWGGSYNDYGKKIAVDSSENVYIAGTTESFGMGYSLDGVLLKYGIAPNEETNGDSGGEEKESSEGLSIYGYDIFIIIGTISISLLLIKRWYRLIT
ncbi:MAG: SBBP repeat-containing protein [Promethearchaeia archaeon]